jgi:hypothetical protein
MVASRNVAKTFDTLPQASSWPQKCRLNTFTSVVTRVVVDGICDFQRLLISSVSSLLYPFLLEERQMLNTSVVIFLMTLCALISIQTHNDSQVRCLYAQVIELLSTGSIVSEKSAIC